MELTNEQKQKYRVAIARGYFKNFSQQWKHTFTGAYVWKHPNRVKTIDTFRDMLGHAPDWEDITDTNLKDFREQLGSLTANSLKTELSEIKAIINDNIYEHPVPSKMYNKILTAKKQPSQSVYLTVAEISRIVAYVPRTDNERYVRRIFLIEALTGARNVDSSRISMSNCDLGQGTLSYVSRKTHTLVTLPVHRSLVPILQEEITGSEKMFLATFNYVLRSICRKCGINSTLTVYRHGKESTLPKYMFVSSHTGRRSFATNLFVNQVDIYTISRFMGHSSTEMTQRYILGFRATDENAVKFFNKAI